LQQLSPFLLKLLLIYQHLWDICFQFPCLHNQLPAFQKYISQMKYLHLNQAYHHLSNQWVQFLI